MKKENDESQSHPRGAAAEVREEFEGSKAASRLFSTRLMLSSPYNVYTYTYIHIYIYVYIYIYTNIYMYKYTYMYMYVYVYMYI